MAEYERSRVIFAAPDDVFAFAADPRNLPTYLPTVRAAEPEGDGERVRVHGERHGQPYEDDGWFRVDPARRRMEWGSDERNYSGEMAVSDDGGNALVVVRLVFAPFVDPTGRPTPEEPAGTDRIEESLEVALDSLRNLIEGTGGKEEPASAT